MSGRGGVRVNNNGGGGKSEIPAGCRKMVQSLKEIVNCSESEIYSMLQECNMDPNEAVGRLLSQDTFHEVKSKREKKKENKDGTDNRFRGANNISQRSGRGGSDRYGRGGSTQFSSNDSGVSHGKPAYRKENGVHAYSGSSYSASGSSYSASAIPTNNINMRPPLHSDSVATDNKMLTTSAVDGVSSSSKPSSGFQSSWLGVPGQVSMADIVKMGRPQNRAPAMPPHQGGNHGHLATSTITASHHDLHAPDVHASKVPEISAQSGVAANDHTDFNDEWPSIEQPPVASASSVLEVPVSQLYDAPSSLPMDITKQHMKAELDDYHSSEYTLNGNLVGSASVPSRSVQEDVSGDSSLFDNNNLYGNESSYHSHRHAFEHNEAEDISASVVANLQRLSVHDNEQETSGDEEDPPVIIPTHLQVHAQECSHLSFGSFGAGIGSTTSGSFATRPLENSLEETPEEVDASSGGHLDTRKNDYYGDEQLNNGDEENLVHRTGGDAVTYSSPSVQQAEVPDEASVAPQANQSAYPTAAPGFAFDNSQQLSAAYDNPQASSQMQNVAPFSSVVQQAYTNSLPSTLLSSDIPTGREPDLSYLSFPMSQPMGTKYGTAAPSNNGPSISMPEALRGSSISPQPTPQTLAGANIATGPALPQQLPVHPYSQPTLPLGHYANMIGYPFLPQSYTYMPSAFQQNFAGNNTYHQSLAAMLPQYKNNVSASNLPQSAGVASGYGFGSSTSIPAGNFPLNSPTVSVGTTIGYEDVLGSQYKEVNHLISLQQNESSAMWLHGPGSRTMSAVPASTYYNMQGQNQQPSGFRQGQQPSQQHYGALGYPNYYHSQTGVLMEHQQQQNPREGSLGGSQGQAGKQAQLWQSSY